MKRTNSKSINNYVCTSEITFEDLTDYVFTLHFMLKEAVEEEKQIVFVTSHINPDTDIVVSTILEAYRLNVENKNEDKVILPLIQSDIMPAEVAKLLGEEIYSELVYKTDVDIDDMLTTGRVSLVFLDRGPMGSGTSLVAVKYAGMCYNLDDKLSRIAYGALLMYTENRSSSKTTELDAHFMDLFKEKSGVTDDTELYSELMSEMLSETDIQTLFYRDYKIFKGFGFSTIKVCDFINRESFTRKIRRFRDIARENNEYFDYYLTLIKLTEYEKGGLKVSRERIYYIFNDTATEQMQKHLVSLIEHVAMFFLEGALVEHRDGYIEITETPRQLSRKKLAPALECMIDALSRYVYISSIDKYVARDFLKKNTATEKLGIPVSYDDKDRVCGVTFADAKRIAAGLGMEIADLKEFWNIYAEAETSGNLSLLESISIEDFSEYIDTVSVDGKIIYKPEISGNEVLGEREKANIAAVSGFFRPREISMLSGLPMLIYPNVNNPEDRAWKYLSPAREGTYAFSRTYSSFEERSCLDGGLSIKEGNPSLGIRLISREKPVERVWTDISKESLTIWYKSAFDDTGRAIFTCSDFKE